MKRAPRVRGRVYLLALLTLATVALVLYLLRDRADASPPASAPFASLDVTGSGAHFGARSLTAPGVVGFCLILEGTGIDPPATGSLVLEGGGRSLTLAVALRRGSTRLCIPALGIGGFVPSSVSWSFPAAGRPRVVRVEPISAGSGEPITAELGAVLLVERSRWRGADFESYRWSDIPDMLVVDTASYELQDRMFKRLSFFVEKEGYAGSIPEPEAVADLHGFNAHDYRAEDLARFFAAASDERIELLPEERRLRELLLRAGVLRTEGGRPRAGKGGVISISRDSTPELRERLLGHEALHGLYFTSPAFRAAVASAWNGASSDLTRFVELYLSRPNWSYDLGNSYLLQNEFMAYLLQYRRSELDSQLLGPGAAWIRQSHPDLTAWAERFVREHRGELFAVYDALDAELWRELGVHGGELIRLSLKPER